MCLVAVLQHQANIRVFVYICELFLKPGDLSDDLVQVWFRSVYCPQSQSETWRSSKYSFYAPHISNKLPEY